MALHHHRGGSGEPLVLVHGLASHWQAWGRVLPALEARHEVLAIDLPGFGGSAPDGTGPSVEEQAVRVERFFAEAGVERPHVCGFSMGGGIALELARRGAVRSATAIAPVGFWTPRERAWCQRSLDTAVSAGKALGPLAPTIARSAVGRTALLGQNFARPWRMTPEEVLGTLQAATTCPGFRPCNDAFTGHCFHDGDELRGVPVTVAWGDKDRLLLYRQAARAAKALPWATHVTLHGCGHVPFTDDEDQAARAILAGAALGSAVPAAAA
ncbi:MAG: alpha/beta fold hydrolase [Solirubrobacterales bacterium]|nr:alpha/beta fold hydrolase [Solirubrobacterales bacterium]